MKLTITRFLLLLFLFFGSKEGMSQNYILAVSSATNNKAVYLLHASDGSVVNSSFLNLNSHSPGTLKGVLQVEDKIWITDQTGDKIFIYDIYGTYQSQISTGLDNIRGLELVNNEVWVTNDGNANGATPDTIMRYSLTGSFLGYYLSSNTSLFDLVDAGNGVVYVSGLTNQGIQKINYSGESLGNLEGNNVFQNIQQINLSQTGDLLAAVFQNNASSGNAAGVYKVSTVDGSIVNRWAASSLRGVIELDNGDILYSNDVGIYKINTTNNSISNLLTGSFQYFAKAYIPHLHTPSVEKIAFNLYPNPTSDSLEIKSDTVIESIRVWDLQGKLVLSQEVQANMFNIDVSAFASGTYLIQTTSGTKTSQLKFIKK